MSIFVLTLQVSVDHYSMGAFTRWSILGKIQQTEKDYDIKKITQFIWDLSLHRLEPYIRPYVLSVANLQS